MVSFLHRLTIALAGQADLFPVPTAYHLNRWGGRPGRSKTTVAQDRRRAKKARAVKRAKRHGQA